MPFRILALDGGGSWALIEVRTLIALYDEDTRGHAILRDFDLVAATSGGSLALAALVENLKLGEILAFYRDEARRRALFPPTTKIADQVLQQTLKVGPKYSAAAKLSAIEHLLPSTGKMVMDGILKIASPNGPPVHLLITSFNYDRNRATFFRSASASGASWGNGQPAKVTLAEAVHASTNAPVNFYDAPAILPSALDRYWDGGIAGCNNPVGVAVVEAIVLGQSPQNLHVLSLGTGSVSLPLAAPGAPATAFEAARTRSTLLKDVTKLSTAILDDPPDAATFMAHAITGGSVGLAPPLQSRVVRMSPLISPHLDPNGSWQAPAGMSADAFRYLCGIGMDALTPFDIAYIEAYCTAWLQDQAPNQPIRANGQAFDPATPEVGYATFSEAAAAWRSLGRAEAESPVPVA